MKYRIIRSINGWYSPQVFVVDSWHSINGNCYSDEYSPFLEIVQFQKCKTKQLGMYVMKEIVLEMEDEEKLDLLFSINQEE